MNFKDRGITVGDLLLVLIIIISTTFLIKYINNNKQTSINFINQENYSHVKI